MTCLPERLLGLIAWCLRRGDEVLLDQIPECGDFRELDDVSQAPGLVLISTSLPLTLDEIMPLLVDDAILQSALGQSSLELASLVAFSAPLVLSPLGYYGIALAHLGVVWPGILQQCLQSLFMAEDLTLSFFEDSLSINIHDARPLGQLRLGGGAVSHHYRCCAVRILAARSASVLLDSTCRSQFGIFLREWLPSVRIWRFEVHLHTAALVSCSGFGFLGHRARYFHCFFEQFLR